MAAEADQSPWLERLRALADEWTADPATRDLLAGALLTGVALVVLFLVVRLSNRLLRRVHSAIEARRLPALRIQSLEVVSADRVTDMLKGLARGVRLVALLLLLYAFVPLVLSAFPWTRQLLAGALPWILAPIYTVVWGVIGFLPSLGFIIVVVIGTRYVLRFSRLLFAEVEKGAIAFPGFHQEWASPTAKLLNALVIVFAIVLISPHLPGFGSPAFQGVSIFLGVLLSLGSTAAIANLVAGVALIYMRPFTVGDRVQIAETTGDVVEKSMLMTRLRTPKNVEVTIPNAMVLANQMINYSAMAAAPGLILHTTITLGYDVPWRRVDELLTAAAAATEDVETDPAPFVLQTGLDDFSVAYELNVHVRAVQHSPRIRSHLHRNIQDRFAEAKIEILSPHFTAVRDGSPPVLP